MPDIQDYWRSLSDEDHRIASEALEESIQHWRENVEARVIKHSSCAATDCALCDVFTRNFDIWESRCSGCPIAYFTGGKDCCGTPYWDALNGWKKWKEQENREAFTAAAQAELDFLISLRPKEKRG